MHFAILYNLHKKTEVRSDKMDQNRINRINELARKSKTVGLTPEEKQEQQRLRNEYINEFRNSLKSTLDSIVIMDEKGNKRPLKQKTNTTEKH